MLLATGLRLYRLDYQSLWLDELYSIIPADPQNSLASIIEYAKSDQPPLFFIYIHYVFVLFGYNEIAGRAACAFLGVVGILAVYFLGKECGGKSVGLFAAFLTAFSYFHIYYSQELRFYSMAFLLSTLSYLYFIRAFRRNKVIDFAGYVVFTVCLLYTHYFGIIIFCTQMLTFPFILIYKRGVKFIISSLLSGMTVAIAFFPWIPIIINESHIKTNWIEVPHPFFLAEYFYAYTGKEIITTLVSLFFIYLFGKSLKEKSQIAGDIKPVYLIIILWIILSYLLPYVRSITSAPLLQPRYTIVTLPAWMLLFAMGWGRIENLKWKLALPFVLIVAFAGNMIFFKKHYTRLDKDQFRESSEVVKANNQSHYPIYSALPWHFNYYFRNQPEKVARLNKPDLASLEYFWLLQGHYNPDQMETEILELKENFKIVEKKTFLGSNAVLFKRK